ncbi:MAG: HAMP domain-containing sensor histidine kinase [Gemmatimonadaceae bacterium]
MTIRARLTIWYAGMLAVVTMALAGASYALLERWSLRRVDDTLRATTAAFSAAWIARQVERDVVPSAIEVLNGFASTASTVEIVLLDGVNAVIARQPRHMPGLMERAPRPRILALVARATDARHVVTTVPGEDAPRRVLATSMRTINGPLLVLVALSLAERRALLREARMAGGVSIAVILALALAGAYFLAGRALGPVQTLATQATRLGVDTTGRGATATPLAGRLRAPNERDELGELAHAFNALLERLERAFAQQREFMADASHELRTPLAVVRAEVDVALTRQRAENEYREALRVIHSEGVRMSRLVDDLLLLSRSDAGFEAVMPADLYLDEVVGDAVRGMRTLAETHGASIDYRSDGELPMRGDASLLHRLVTNLLDNAIKHGGGEITVRAERDRAGAYLVSVADRGPGIAPEIRERLFERFVRGARRYGGGEATPADRGSGLGLALARRIAELHAGRLELARGEPGGTEFRLTLPA